MVTQKQLCHWEARPTRWLWELPLQTLHGLQAAQQSRAPLLLSVWLPRISSPTAACYSLCCWGVALQNLASFYSCRHNTFDYLLRLTPPPRGDASVGRRILYKYSRKNKVLGLSSERLYPCLSEVRGRGPEHSKPSSPRIEKEMCSYTWNPGSPVSAIQCWTPESVKDSAAHSPCVKERHLQGRVKDPQQRS